MVVYEGFLVSEKANAFCFVHVSLWKKRPVLNQSIFNRFILYEHKPSTRINGKNCAENTQSYQDGYHDLDAQVAFGTVLAHIVDHGKKREFRWIRQFMTIVDDL